MTRYRWSGGKKKYNNNNYCKKFRKKHTHGFDTSLFGENILI